MMRPTIVSISGFSSNVGKTTLMCELLQRFPGWEAIKISRGHYRSCGKAPEACCISPLLRERPTIFSETETTCVEKKDTGRYWEAVASQVQWLVCTNEQLEEGTSLALSRVQSAGVFIEGTSFLKYIPADFSIMVVAPERNEIKGSAVRMIEKMQAFYISGTDKQPQIANILQERLRKRNRQMPDVPIYFPSDLPQLVDTVQHIHQNNLAAVPHSSVIV
jgi:molybdopterin-guanine dinucleotide biosynthesis protein